MSEKCVNECGKGCRLVKNITDNTKRAEKLASTDILVGSEVDEVRTHHEQLLAACATYASVHGFIEGEYTVANFILPSKKH